MTLNLSVPGQGEELKPRITVFGVGGAGGNAVNNMIEKQLEGCEFVVANTDAQALQQSHAQARVQLGVKVTEGLGAGARPSVGAAAAEESIEQIVDHLAGSHMCFITAGMGGGTGTGAAPIIAQAARELGVLTVGVVTKPFQFEGAKRMRQAEAGVEALQKMVDTLIIIPNQNLFRLANEKTTFTEAFSLADDVLYQGVKGVTDLMVRPGLINLDFADVRAVMDEMGKAMMGTGEADGETRALQAAEKAIANPLLDEISLKGAKGVLINITGGHDLTLFELDEAANRIREEVDPDANIIVGSTLDETMEGRMRVSVVATGIDATDNAQPMPQPRRSLAEPLRSAEEVEQSVGHKPQPEPQPAPVQQPAMTRQQPAPAAQAPQRGQMHQEEDMDNAPNLFGGEAPQNSVTANVFAARAAAQQARPQAPAPRGQGTELPPPAYQPRPAATRNEVVEEQGYEQAAMPRRAGEPSPETMARLKAAIGKTNREVQERAQTVQSNGRRTETQPAQEKSRFGINSLINRMTGHSDHGQAPARGQQPAPAAPRAKVEPPRAPQGGAYQDPQAQTARRAAPAQDPDQDRIEIPAFLRRQAN
ncbi:cell division protein FtsZ [Pseudooceanicola sp. CBS1P-1]|uniref:Cell division protein FtsZ n=1 Tax=Pseudooceanicola albus TaxID=2692189 RepID=A0A6L7FZM6_9RHOB|nr:MULTISPECIES: cell division protein FtsZ [Pseudooceanicola]MBT9382578.1 cell division protein FtsZ [Pseudooceanicola endophyticus]MXN17119.1 cell division protein FtsZ [Pseudooceanicola albus]